LQKRGYEMDDLTKLRNTINKIDNQLFALLDQRFELSRRVKEVKKEQSTPIFDPKREQRILDSIPTSKNQEYVKEVYKTLFTLSKQIQEKV